MKLVFSNKREYKVFNNLTKDDRSALLDLRKDKTILVKPADKGGSIVVMNFANYDLEVERQLNDNVFYNKLSTDPTNVFKNEIQEYLQQFVDVGEITKQEFDFRLITQLHQSFI